MTAKVNMTRTREQALQALLKTLAVLGYSVLSAFLQGYALSCYWIWFAVALFPGLPAIGVAHALGFVILLRLVMPIGDRQRLINSWTGGWTDEECEAQLTLTKATCLGYVFATGVGYLLHLAV